MGILSTPARLCVYTHTISKQLITYGTQDVTSTVERPLDVNGVPSLLKKTKTKQNKETNQLLIYHV